MLFDFGKVKGTVTEGLAEERSSRARLVAKADQLARDTALAIVEVLRNRRLQEVSEREIARIGEIVKLVDERADNGASTDSDRVQALARLESARAARVQYETSFRRQLANLASLTGQEAMPEDRFPKWLPAACSADEPQWDSVSDVLIAEAEQARAKAKLDSSRVEPLPTVALEASASYAIDRDAPDRTLGYSVGVNVSSPLYQGNAMGARMRAAGFALQEAEVAVQRARTTAKDEYRAAREQVASLRDLYQTLVRRARIMKEARDLYHVQYEDLGTRTILNILDAEKELHEAELLAINAEHDLQRLYVTCLYNSGKSRERFGVDETLAQRVGASE